MIIPREQYIEKIRGFMNQPELVKVITGLRRSGKSVLLELVKKELEAQGVDKKNMLSYNFEDLSLRDLKDFEKLHDHLKSEIEALKGRAYVFLDEIQEVENWEACINSLRVTTDADIYLTGSNSRMLAGDFATRMAGRYIEIKVYPFSYREFLSMLKAKGTHLSEKEAFSTYLNDGGMPFLANIWPNDSDVRQYLRDIYASVVIKDIMRHNRFRDIDLLERIITYVMANIGKTFSANSISKYFKSEQRKVSPETIMNYLKGCEEAYLFEKVSRLDMASKKVLQINEKYYVADHGLREAVYGGNEQAVELIFENIVCLELLRRGYTLTVGRIGDNAIDFVGRRNGEYLYVQVYYLLASPETVEREFGPLANIADNYPKYVVSDDDWDMSRNGIRHRNIRDFLLQDEY